MTIARGTFEVRDKLGLHALDRVQRHLAQRRRALAFTDGLDRLVAH